MGDISVSNTNQAAIAQAPGVKEGVQKAADFVKKELTNLKDFLFGDTDPKMLAAVATGAIIGGITFGLPGAALGAAAGAVGSALGTTVREAIKGEGMDESKRALATAAATVGAAVVFGPAAALVTGFSFATGAAQNAAEKIAGFFSRNEEKAEAAGQ